jgi:predicted acyl esterase
VIVTTFPRSVRVIEHILIPLKDGTTLAARMWLPDDAERNPVPAILEYLPYRKRDGTYERDALTHPYLAGHGYAGVRVDIRGSGESAGLLLDEYSEQELADGVEVIAWLAAQPWCSGVVGMMGISWGGFNGLQIAARRPPALKAIVTICSSDDRYADDAHYMGGTLIAAGLEWAFFFFGTMCLPPDPLLVREGWRATWLERLANAPLFFEIWLQHQRRDSYWKRGSVCEDYSAIQCPVYAVGGWTDAYTNTIPRLLGGLTVPRKGLIGPWAHAYPHFALPGPQVGFLQEMLRWWDYWLKGIDTGVMDEPMLRAWMMESVRPASHHETLPGRWIAESSWPSPGITPRRLFLTDEGLRDETASLTARAVRSPQTVGKCGGNWVPFGRGTIRQVTKAKTTCGLWFSRRRRSMRRSSSWARRSSRSMSHPTGRRQIWWFGYAMCIRPGNRCASALACSTSRAATDMKNPNCWRSENATACASSSTMPAPFSRPATGCG